MNNNIIIMAGSGFISASIVMCLLWLRQHRTENAGIVDIGWSGTIPLLAVFYAYWSGTYTVPRVWIALAFIICWGGRLVWHIHRRSYGRPEDGRYRELRNAWGKDAPWKMFIFFQFQALAAVIFSLPFLLIALDTRSEIHILEEIGFLLMWFSLAGESAADKQLSQFKKKSSSRGTVCQDGLWNYSRHPNYFFEWMIWVSIAIYALPSPNGIYAVICPMLMLFFLFKVTGIPATEEQALKSRGDAYRAYQASTSAFFPWFKKRKT